MISLRRESIGAAACVLGGGVLWGFIGVFSSLLSDRGLSSMQLTVCRGVVTVLFLFLLILVTGPRQLFLRARDVLLFSGMGICSVTLFNFLYLEAIRRLDSLAMASVLLYTSPMFVAVLSAAIFREKFRAANAAAILLSFGGCMCVAGFGPATPSFLGILFGLGAGFSYGLYSIFGKLALRRYPPLTVVFYTFLFGTAFSLPLTDLKGLALCLQPLDTAFLTVLFGVVCSVLPYILYTRGLARMPSSRASILATVEPCVATAAGVFLFHQRLTPVMLLGVALVVSAILLLHIRFPHKLQ